MLLYSISANSQCVIKGNIMSYSGRDTLIGVSCLLFFSSDTSYYKTKLQPFKDNYPTRIKGIVSNLDGCFFIDSIPTNKYNLLIINIAFESFLIKNVILKSNDTIDLGNIYLFQVPLVSGMNTNHHGDLDEVRKRNKSEFLIRYPSDGEMLKMNFEHELVTIEFTELLKCYKRE